MSQHTCQNPECKKIYSVENEQTDDGTCCYDCFEKVYCHAPVEVKFENLEAV